MLKREQIELSAPNSSVATLPGVASVRAARRLKKVTQRNHVE